MIRGIVPELRGGDLAAIAQTDTELIAAQGAGVKIAVLQLYITSDVEQTITFESESTEVHTQFVAAGGGSVLPYTGVPWFVTNANEALTYTSSAAGKVRIQVIAGKV